MGKLRVLSGQAVCAILKRHGFGQVRQRGSHIVMQRATDEGTSFPDDESVNEALRLVLRVMSDTSRLSGRCTGAENTSGQEDVGQFFGDSDRLEVG